MTFPSKPVFGQPCNGCGLCCAVTPCEIGQSVFGKETGRCPALEHDSGRFWCGLVRDPAGYSEAFAGIEAETTALFSHILGIDEVCDSWSEALDGPRMTKGEQDAVSASLDRAVKENEHRTGELYDAFADAIIREALRG